MVYVEKNVIFAHEGEYRVEIATDCWEVRVLRKEIDKWNRTRLTQIYADIDRDIVVSVFEAYKIIRNDIIKRRNKSS